MGCLLAAVVMSTLSLVEAMTGVSVSSEIKIVEVETEDPTVLAVGVWPSHALFLARVATPRPNASGTSNVVWVRLSPPACLHDERYNLFPPLAFERSDFPGQRLKARLLGWALCVPSVRWMDVRCPTLCVTQCTSR
jgi:hypothetical protein